MSKSKLKVVDDTKQTKPKQLTMTQVKRDATQTNKMEEYILSNGSAIQYYPIFSQRRISDMLKEYQEKTRYAKDKDILLPEDQALEYIYFLCIKHFTSLKKGISDKYESQITQMEHLVVAGYFTEIVNDVFMKSEIEKVFDAITDLLSTSQLLENISVQINRKTEDLQIKNKDIMNVLAENPFADTVKH